MSEVIETFIRANPGLSEGEAFEGFLKQDRIRAWVGTDKTRRERLQKEFSKVWTEMAGAPPSPAPMHAAPAPAPAPSSPAPTARAGPAMAQAVAPPIARSQPAAPETVPVARPMRRHAGAGSRKLDLMCPACGHIDVWNEEGIITCRSCERTYNDMLLLVPVQPVGTFEYVFGGGASGWLVAGGIVVLLAGVYLLVKLAG